MTRREYIVRRVTASGVALALLLGFMSVTTVPVFAAATDNPIATSCAQDPGSVICTGKDQKLFGAGSIWTNVINTMIYVVGAVAALMIVVGGLRYTLSGGDQSQIKAAKETILYSVVGIVVAVASYAIVNFVLSRL